MAFAYSPETREVKAVRLNATEGHPIKVTPKMVPRTCVVGLHLEGPKITRVAVFNIESGKWSPLDLDEPASGVVQPMALGHGALAYQVGRFLYMYSSKTSTWDRLELQAITQGQPIRVTPTELKGAWVVGLRVEGPKITRVAVYNIESGKWSPLDLDEPASGVVQPMALGPGAVAYQVGRFFYVYHAKTSKWDRLDVECRRQAGRACDQRPMRRAPGFRASGGAGATPASGPMRQCLTPPSEVRIPKCGSPYALWLIQRYRIIRPCISARNGSPGRS